MGPHYRRLLRQWRLGSGTRSGPPAISWPPSVVKERNRNLTLVVASDVLPFLPLFQRWENVKVASSKRASDETQ